VDPKTTKARYQRRPAFHKIFGRFTVVSVRYLVQAHVPESWEESDDMIGDEADAAAEALNAIQVHTNDDDIIASLSVGCPIT
jgi:hypothetical protein